jgi:peptide/nickel transport system permease protein
VHGSVDALSMRVCEVMLSFPSILIALLFAGVEHALFANASGLACFGVVIVAIAFPGGAGGSGDRLPPLRIVLRDGLPNVTGRVLLLSTIQVAVAILAETTLSFLGLGVSPTSRSPRTVHQQGQKSAFQWGLVACHLPGATLVLIALTIKLFGDWLRDALNPRLR